MIYCSDIGSATLRRSCLSVKSVYPIDKQSQDQRGCAEGIFKMLRTTGKIFRLLWILFCIAAGALMGALALSGTFSSTPIAAVVGGVLGGLFGKFVPLFAALEAWFD